MATQTDEACVVTLSETGVQTTLKSEDMVNCDSQVLTLRSAKMFTEESFGMKCDDFIRVYTVLLNFYTLKLVFEFVVPPLVRPHKLSNFQEFLVVLFKLRLNCCCQI